MRRSLRNFIKSISIFFVSVFCSFSAFAQGLNLEMNGGLSAPAPGISGALNVCARWGDDRCVGISNFISHNESTKKQAKWLGEHYTVYFEQNFPIRDRYHLIYSQIALGAAYIKRTNLGNLADVDGDFKKWSPSMGGGAGVELPIADRMGLRVGVQLRYPMVAGGVTQVAGSVGVRMGAEWLGVGD